MINLILKKIKGLNIIKTIYANFRVLPFKSAIKFPIFIYGNTTLKNLAGNKIIIAPQNLRTGILNIGTPILNFQHKNTTTVFNIKGTININGKVVIGRGCSIEVGKDGILSIGNNTTITGSTTILCTQSITIGARCMISWENLIMDTDWHNIIIASSNHVLPKEKPVVIGDHVWMGCRCSILKGANISSDTIVASNSKVTKKFEQNNILIGSNTILKQDVTW